MKKNNYILLLLVYSLFSCGEKEELPKGVLSETAMVNLMVDMEIAQATLKFEHASEGINPNYTKAYMQVCQSNNITLEQFNINLDYYCSEPIKMRQVYDEVIVRLSEKQGELNEDYIKQSKTIQ